MKSNKPTIIIVTSILAIIFYLFVSNTFQVKLPNESKSEVEVSVNSKLAEDTKVVMDEDRDMVVSFINEETKLNIMHCDALYNKIKSVNNPELTVPVMMAIYYTESRFNPKAYNESSEATGMAQFLPQTAKWLTGYLGINYKYEYLYDPSYSINLSVELMKFNLEAGKNDLTYALNCYGGSTDGSYARKVLELVNHYNECLDKYRVHYKANIAPKLKTSNN